MAMPVPIEEVANTDDGEPLTETTSGAIIPDRVAVPLREAVVVASYALLFPVKPEIVKFLAVISAVKEGCVKVYRDACAPANTNAPVTVFPVPTLASEKVPLPLKVTVSEPTMPTNEPPVIVAVFVLSYVLLVAEAPEIVSVFTFTVKLCATSAAAE